jgi:hypothetical protein
VQTFSTPFPFNFSPGVVVIAGLLQSFRVGEDVPIESELVTQALDRVQTQVEEQYRGVRRQVFRLDEVAAYQRAVVYSQRRAYLTSSDEGAFFFLIDVQVNMFSCCVVQHYYCVVYTGPQLLLYLSEACYELSCDPPRTSYCSHADS